MSPRAYNTIHQWVGRHWNKTGVCENCKQTKVTQWANKDHTYSKNRKDWAEWCISCHRRLDLAKFGHTWKSGRDHLVYDKLTRRYYPLDGVNVSV